MIAVIRYKTPYFINQRYPLFVYFSLGNDASLRCVLEFLTLLALGGLIDLVKGEFVCSEVTEYFLSL